LRRSARSFFSISFIIVSAFFTQPLIEVVQPLKIVLTDALGESVYQLNVKIPQEVVRGESLNLTFIVLLDSLPPLKHYSGYVSLTFTLMSPDGRLLARRSINTRADPYRVEYIYPGHRWGPYSISIKPDYTISEFESMRLLVTLESEEYVEDPLGIPVIPTRPNPVTVEVGTVRVVAAKSDLVFTLAAAFTVPLIGIIVFFLLRRGGSIFLKQKLMIYS